MLVDWNSFKNQKYSKSVEIGDIGGKWWGAPSPRSGEG
jgi:hypothetical protein